MGYFFMFLWLISGIVGIVYLIRWLFSKIRKTDNEQKLRIKTGVTTLLSVLFLVVGVSLLSNTPIPTNTDLVNQAKENNKSINLEDYDFKQIAYTESELPSNLVNRIVIFETDVTDKDILIEHGAKHLFDITKESGKLTSFGYVYYYDVGKSNVPDNYDFETEFHDFKLLYWKSPNGNEFVRIDTGREEVETSYRKLFEQLVIEQNLELIEHDTLVDGPIRYVVGKIKNNTKKTYSYVQVEISLYDNEGNLVGSTLDNVNNLGSGDVWKFKAPIFETDAKKYEIKGITGF